MKMKKYIKYVIMTAIVLCLAIVFIGNTMLDAKSKVVTVKTTTKTPTKENNVKMYGVVKGLDKNGKVVWTYRTPKETPTEISCVLCKTKGNSVYVVTAGRFIRLKKSNGKEVCNVKNVDFSGATTLDVQNGVCYTSAYYGNYLLKISKDGEILWKTGFDTTKYFWPYKVKVTKKKVKVWFDNSYHYENVKLPHIMTMDKKTGKILSGKK